MTTKTFVEFLLEHRRDRPTDVALILPPSSARPWLTWRQLSACVAHATQRLGQRFDSQPGLPRRLGHASDNGIADILIALASVALGTIEIPIDSRLPEDEILRRRQRVGGLWIDRRSRDEIVRDALAAADDDRVPQPARAGGDVDTPSLILWTSGTTKEPQGVVLSQRNLVGNAIAKLAAVPQRRDDIRLTVLPLSHAYARTCDLGTWLISGCTLAVTLGMSHLCRIAPSVRPTLVNAVPTVASQLLENPERGKGFERLRLLGCGGAPLSQAAFDAWRNRGVTVIQGYGLTETSPVICSATPDNAMPGLVGDLVAGWEGEIRQGELFVRGPHVMLGYWDRQDESAKRIDADGWLRTGDAVERDDRTGQFRILGRTDEVIVLPDGRKLYPSVVERELRQIAGVRHAMIVWRAELEVWIDSVDDIQQLERPLRELLACHPPCDRSAVRQFDPPLSRSAGELTMKGSLRRTEIENNRFRV